MKSEKAMAKRDRATEDGGAAGSKPKASQKRKKGQRKEPTANDLMLEAWKKLYQARHDRLV